MVVGSFQRGNHQRAPVLTAGCSYFLVDDAEGQTFASHTSRTSGLPCWIINLDETKTLDRARLAAAAGDVINVFNVDAGVYPKAAAKLSLTEREAHQKTMALFYYTVGTSAILGHSSLSVDVRQPAFVDA